MMFSQANEIDAVIKKAEQLSKEFEHYFVGCEHVFLSLILLNKKIDNFFKLYNLNYNKVKESLLLFMPAGDKQHLWSGIIKTPRMQRVLVRLPSVAKEFSKVKADQIQLLYSILKEDNGVVADTLNYLNLDKQELLENTKRLILGEKVVISAKYKKDNSRTDNKGKADKNVKGSILNKLGRNLVNLAREGKISPVIGRKDEIKRIMQILTRKSKNNPILIGEAGVGKTAVVEGLAYLIAFNKVPSVLSLKRIIEINMASLVAGTSHRGEFEDRLNKLIKEASSNPNIILFIDEIHTIVGAGDSKGSLDAANIFKPALARGEFSCIGATTNEEYNKYIAKDQALMRRFQPVLINEPDFEDTLKILKGIKKRYEKHHGVVIPDLTLEFAIKSSIRYLPERYLPDKAIDLIDEACSRVKMKSINITLSPVADIKKDKTINNMQIEVKQEDIAEVISLWTGIPVNKLTEDEKSKLLHLEEELKKRVKGQDEAIEKVSQVIKISRLGLDSPNKPNGVFLFMGPTGVGKTELAKAIAEYLFGDEKDLIRFDMSEFMEKHSISKLIGAPPGYVGYDEEGQLTKRVRSKPYSVILFDEIEKAHPQVFDLFLQIFDDGRLTDARGRVVNFTNTIIIMTSNIGAKLIIDNLDKSNLDKLLMNELLNHFRPEFINRIDETIVFKPLSEKVLREIVEREIEKIQNRVKDKNITFSLTDAAFKFLVKVGYKVEFGARPLLRAIQDNLIKELANEMLSGRISAGDKVVIDSDDNKLILFKEENLENGLN